MGKVHFTVAGVVTVLAVLFGLFSWWNWRDRPSEPGDQLIGFARSLALADAVGVHELVPALPPRLFSSREQLDQWRDTTRARLEQVFQRQGVVLSNAARRSKMDGSPPGIVRESVQFKAEDGTVIPAVLQYAERSSNSPAVMLIPGHVPSGRSGLSQLVLEQDSYQRAAATELAKRGYVTLAFELRGFGLLGLRSGAEHNAIAYNQLLRGSFYKSLVVQDARQAISFLRSLPQVDPRRIGVAGVSIGGELAMTVAAMDMRVRAVAASGYGGTSGVFPAVGAPDTTIIHYCHIIPGAGMFLRTEDMTLLVAPRHVLIARGSQEYTRDDSFVSVAGAVWRLLDAPGRLDLKIVPDKAHEFFVEETVRFFEAALAIE